MYYFMSQSQSWYWPGASVSTSELIQQADEYYTVTIEVYYVDTITVNIGGNYTDSGYMQHYVTNDGQSHDLPSKDDVEERFEEWAFTHTATGFNTRSDGTGTQYNLGAAIGTDGLMQLYDGNTYILYVTWEALPLAQLIVHANNETDDTYEQTIPTNAPYQVPEYEILPWDWEYDGYISVGLSLSANGSNPYGFGRNVPADVLQNAISDGCIHLYCAWSDTAVRGFIYGNFEGAKPEFIAEIVEEGGSLTLPPANAVKGIWDYNGTPLGYSTAEDGDVEYALGANITYAQICAIEGHSLYVIWERDPVLYTVQYYLIDGQTGNATELTSDSFSNEDETYTMINAPQGCEGLIIMAARM